MSDEWQSIDSKTAASDLTFSWKVESFVYVSIVYADMHVCVHTGSCCENRVQVLWASNSYLEGSPSKVKITSCTYVYDFLRILYIPLFPRFSIYTSAVIHACPQNPSPRCLGI